MVILFDIGLSIGGYESSKILPRQGGAADLILGSAKISPLSTPLWITDQMEGQTPPNLPPKVRVCNPVADPPSLSVVAPGARPVLLPASDPGPQRSLSLDPPTYPEESHTQGRYVNGPGCNDRYIRPPTAGHPPTIRAPQDGCTPVLKTDATAQSSRCSAGKREKFSHGSSH